MSEESMDTRADAVAPAAPASSDPLAEMDRQMTRSSFFLQASMREQGRLNKQVESYLTAVMELLVDKGVISQDELRDEVLRKREQADELEGGNQVDHMNMKWPSIVVREDDPDLSDDADPPVNCAERMHVCKAVCCQLHFALSADEVESGKVKWDLGHPYVIRHNQEGYCVHNDQPSRGCNIYENRPGVCRRYSCANDGRIWKDFDNMVLNEEFLRTRPVGIDFAFDVSSGGAQPARDVPVQLVPKPVQPAAS